jgi:hypothetical protein
MLTRTILAAVAACLPLAAAHHCLAQARNCPVAFDQLVIVEPGRPAAFRLHVENFDGGEGFGGTGGIYGGAGDGFGGRGSGFGGTGNGGGEFTQVTIFQYPLGGVLQQAGPTPLDFVFVPNADFNGTTSFMYRITPPAGCPRGTELRRVDLAGGYSDSTAAGLVPTVPPHLCGVSISLAVVTSAMMIVMMLLGRRPGLRRTPSSRAS